MPGFRLPATAGARAAVADLVDAVSGANQLRRAVAEAMVYGMKNRRHAG